jgi:hypothetical protein
MGYAQLVQQFELKQEDVASKVGKSRAAVANALRSSETPRPLFKPVFATDVFQSATPKSFLDWSQKSNSNSLWNAF